MPVLAQARIFISFEFVNSIIHECAVKNVEADQELKIFIVKPVTFLNSAGSSCVITSRRQRSRIVRQYMKIGTRVANLMSFS